MPIRNVMRQGLKRAVITGGLEFAHFAGRAGLMATARGMGAIFTLHHVRPKLPQAFDPNAHLEITPEFLEAAIEHLREEGYQFVALADLPARLAIARAGERFAAFTLDDGYRNNAMHAQPVFTRHKVPFTVFVAPGFCCKTHGIWWETLTELLRAAPHLEFDFGTGPVTMPLATPFQKQAAFNRMTRFVQVETDEATAIEKLDAAAKAHGIDPMMITERLVMREPELKSLVLNPLASIGAHTVSHRSLARLSDEEARREMNESADRIAAIIGHRPETFAYPYGNNAAVSPREHRLAKELGFRLAVTTDPGTLSARSFDTPTTLPRISLNGLYQKPKYVGALASGIPFRLLRR
ncbi:polysaccharide deacetylase family protein [Shinella kummerowiae]|jgi:peptidoglycan/xylan/chitin deacetylase (PgdA/CDA1 family)|uniref:Chitooligosaccharide deacetylase n=1 Tax=Shinella kummerowiae TaxID=417745 RepID=A0A6N8SHR3_9HYPH|nr:polysaccharide deacetylase family protein [Shinella kummerowiae]MXN48073.1 polysaccharide deacetylase family protein [Shinella kummerowiae]